MNNKFFADKNDFFKYDLLLEVMEKSPFLKQLTFIPMLTPMDDRKGGELKDYKPGNRRMDLYEFLKKCLNTGRRDIRQLTKFFGKKTFHYTPYRDSTFFSNKTRSEYFAAIPEAALDTALIFFDPDNGLSHSRKTDDKHLTYDELERVYGRARDPSLILVYYHLPRVSREALFRSINWRLDHFQPRPKTTFIHDNRIAFLSLAKQPRIHANVETILRDYAARIPIEPGVWSPLT